MILQSKTGPGLLTPEPRSVLLTFFIQRDYRYTIETYLESWAPELRRQVRSVGYEDLPAQGHLEPGTYIFCDQERFSFRQRRLAQALWRQMESAGPGVRLFNDPHRVLLRYQLLKQLHQCGQNVFDVHHVWEAHRSRFPAFLHSYGGHEGALSPLVKSRAALYFSILYKFLDSPRTRVMVEEFCDVSVDGVYSKYGAFNLAGVVLPRHLFFGRKWEQKGDEPTKEKYLDQMEDYLLKNPDAPKLQEIFALAGIDFGRIDYSFFQGRLQVWEINTNPLIIGRIPDGTPPREIAMAEQFAARIKTELIRLATLSQEDRAVPYRLSGSF